MVSGMPEGSGELVEQPAHVVRVRSLWHVCSRALERLANGARARFAGAQLLQGAFADGGTVRQHV
jgi:hypothetical protein